MKYESIIKKINYWKSYDGTGDEYRKTHDLDCIQTKGNLAADTIFSLWLPLRYTLNYFEHPKWTKWKENECNCNGLKNCNAFLDDLIENIEEYLPEHMLTKQLAELFRIGQTEANTMILPYRKWNTVRGGKPYWDYLPHFLYDLLDTENKDFLNAVQKWIKSERLVLFFKDGIIDKDHVKDLAGTGNVCSHFPRNLDVLLLIRNYTEILHERARIMRVDIK